ncbi:MAG TPA: exodeoxyribonuclease VII small subunit [Chloroflexi bacterium]|jgi:exodeoxyribonuclease VII small subunit|nr:exodeoxyribonuclease VII small subunit [Chloroflexota bacterium]
MNKEVLDSLSFEDSYAKLEEVIQRLEKGDLSVDESVALYEEGMQLAEHCGRQLDDAELRIHEVLSAVADELEGQSTDE